MNLEDLEKRIEQISADFEKRLEEQVRRLETRFSDRSASPSPEIQRRRSDGMFWGLALVVVGLVILGNHFDWFHIDVPILPAALIILGLFLILEQR